MYSCDPIHRTIGTISPTKKYTRQHPEFPLHCQSEEDWRGHSDPIGKTGAR